LACAIVVVCMKGLRTNSEAQIMKTLSPPGGLAPYASPFL